MRARTICFFIFFVFSLFAAYGETATVQRKLAIFIVYSGSFKEEEKTALSETLLSKISELDSITVIEPMWMNSKDITYVEKSEKSKAIGADCYLSIGVLENKDKITLKFLSFDILQNKVAIEEKSIERQRELRSLDRSFWQPVVAELQTNYHPISGDLVIKEITKHTGNETVVQEIKGIKVVVVAQPHTMIQGLGSATYTADEDGMVRVELPGSTTYELYATCAGFYPVRKQIYIGNEPVRIELNQNTGSSFAIDMYLQQADYIGAGFRYYLVPDKVFADLKTTLFFWKLIWPVSSDRERYEAPLVHLHLLTGFYINNEDALFRFSLSAGMFFRIIYLDPVGIVLDPISSIGVTMMSINMEVSTFDHYRFFLEYNINMYLSENVNLFRASVTGTGSDSNSAPGYIFGTNSIIDLLDFKIGFRWQL